MVNITGMCVFVLHTPTTGISTVYMQCSARVERYATECVVSGQMKRGGM